LSVWLCIPSKRPPEEAELVLKLWRERGYKIALWRDFPDPLLRTCDHLVRSERYPGYAGAVNHLIAEVRGRNPASDWFVAAGDDIEPDMNHTAEEIAVTCNMYFGTAKWALDTLGIAAVKWALDTFGVMQPTGDRWGDTPQSRQRYGLDRGAYIDRVCGSAWIGREFAARMYGGKGPLWPGYTHMYVDEELHDVALKMGVLWQRRDLAQIHRHWGRGPDAAPSKPQNIAQMPEFLRKANEGFAAAKSLFETRRKAGFPGHEPR